MASVSEFSFNQNFARLSALEFNQLTKIVYSQCGINLTAAKKVMLESRLSKRLRTLQISSFKQYIEFVSSKEGIDNELIHMIDVVTTNKTDFFREPHHFEYLKSNILPEHIHASKQTIKVWSAACSTGEEPYTLAMVLQEFAHQHAGFSYSILASDISTQVLQKAAVGIYNMRGVEGLPLAIKQKYLLKSKDKEKPTVRIIPTLREKVNFLRVNLMENVNSWNIPDGLDIIFCRNVLIYFDRETQLEVVKKLTQKLKPGGYFFIGHSESLHAFQLPIAQVRPTIFIKK